MTITIKEARIIVRLAKSALSEMFLFKPDIKLLTKINQAFPELISIDEILYMAEIAKENNECYNTTGFFNDGEHGIPSNYSLFP